MSDWQVLVRLLRFVRPFTGTMALSTTARIVKLLMQTALIAFAAGSVALYVADPSDATLNFIVFGIVGLALVLGVFSYIATYTEHYVAFHILARLRNLFYDRMEPVAPAGTATLRTGDAVSRVINDCERIEPFFAHTISPAITALVVPTILLVYLGTQFDEAYAWTLLPFMLVMVFILPIVTALAGGRGGDAWRRAQGEVNAHLTDSLQSLRDTIAFGYGERRRAAAWALGESLKRGQDALMRADALQRGIGELIVGAAAVAMLWTSWRLLPAASADVLRVVPVVIAVTITSFFAAASLNNVVNDLKVSIVCARRLFELMDQEPAVQDIATESLRPAAPSIAFRNVSFSYAPSGSSPARRVLDGLSFEIPAGRHVALVGSSGAGKSTVANLLLRFWDVQEGEVVIGGLPVQRYRLEDLRGLVAVVAQRSYIFNTTIGHNIRMGRPGATQAEAEDAAHRAGLGDWIGTLPQGLETPVGEMGSKLSGGQRQRVAIARALLKDAPILVLDEATSNLDVDTEREVNAAVRELTRGRTVLTIAHRLSTVLNADEILVLEQGRIVDRGTHTELLRRGGAYTRIFELQQDEVDAAEDFEDAAFPA